MMMSADVDSLLRNTWQPSVLSMETVGHLPIICERVEWMKGREIYGRGGEREGGV